MAPSVLVTGFDAPVSRRIAQALTCGGLPSRIAVSAEQLTAEAPQSDPWVLVLAAHGMSQALSALSPEQLSCGRILIAASRLDAGLYKLAAQMHQVYGILACTEGEPPPAWQMVAVARRLAGSGFPPLDAHLSWGRQWTTFRLSTTQQRDAAVATVDQYSSALAPHISASAAEAAHELLMNAMYDAPVDATGRVLYAHRRKEPIELTPSQQPEFGYGCDGRRFVMAIRDPFGRLAREHVFSGLHRGLSQGTLQTAGGGAGLGMLVMHQGALALFFDVDPGRKTQVSLVIDLYVPRRELARRARSVLFSSARCAASV